jgi:hypothetical protein
MLAGYQSGHMYFSGICSVAGKEVLLGPANLVDMTEGPHGFEIHYRCHCGRAGVVFPKVETVGRCGRSAIHDLKAS